MKRKLFCAIAGLILAAASSAFAQDDSDLEEQLRKTCLETSFITEQNIQRALDACTNGIDLMLAKPESEQDYQDLVWMFDGRMSAYRDLGKCDLALRDIEQVEIYNSKKGVWDKRVPELSRANVYRSCSNDLAAALRETNSFIRQKPEEFSPYHHRALIYAALGDFQRALIEVNLALRQVRVAKSRVPQAHIAKFPKGFWANTLEMYNQNEARFLMYRAATNVKLGQTDAVFPDINQAISLWPNLRAAFILRGEVYRRQGKNELALADFNRGLSFHPGDPFGLTGRGLLYEKMGMIDLARADFTASAAASRFAHSTTEPQETARARLALLDANVPKVDPTNPIVTPQILPPQKPVGRRVALVVGNSAYTKVQPLPNAKNDGFAVADALRKLGFEVVKLEQDLSREALVSALRAFAAESEKADWAMIYFAGHGIEIGGVNYLIPVDAKLETDRDAQYEAIALDQVLGAVEGAKRLRLVVLDACRDNPFVSKIRRTVATRSIGRGLGSIEPSGGTLVVYSAKHGQTALDSATGAQANSPFASAFLSRIKTPGVEITKVLRLIRDDVIETTQGRQEPFTYGSISGREDFYFVVR